MDYRPALPLFVTDGLDDARDAVAPAAIAAVVVALADTLGRWALAGVVEPGLDPVGAALVAVALAVGRPARSGSAVGLLVTGALLGDWTGGAVGAVAGFVAVTVAVRLWTYREERARVGLPVWLLRYALVATVTVLTFASTSAWLADALGRAAFGVVVGRVVVATLPFALLGGPFVRPVVARSPALPWGEPGRSVTGRERGVVVVVIVCWALAGYVASFVFGALALAPPGSIGRRLSPALETFVSLWGWQGTYAQLLLGAVALLVLAATFRGE